MRVGDNVKVAMVKKINGKPTNERKWWDATIVKINSKTSHVRLHEGTVIVKRYKDIAEVSCK